MPTEGGFDVYQVKNYSKALDSGQASKIEKSWNRVNDEFGKRNTITAWYLAMPWDPTTEREHWFQELTEDAEFPCEWKGRGHLNGWAADNPKLVEYFFGSGQERVAELMASLTLDRAELEAGTGNVRLDAVTNRYLQLQTTLDDLSPFYRYQLRLIAASDLVRMRDEDDWGSLSSGSAVVTTYKRVTNDYYVGVSVSPVSESAAEFDPITVRMEIVTGQTDPEELRRYFDYGIAPADAVEAVIVEAHGPPGAVPELAPGRVLLSDVAVQSPWETLALHCTTHDPLATTSAGGSAQGDDGDDAALEIGPIATTEGANGRAFRARGEAIELELFVKREDDSMTVRTWPITIGGKLPHRVLPELAFAKKLWSGEFYVCLTVPNGPLLVEPVRPPARPDDVQAAQQWTDVAFHLTVLQRFSHRQLLMPHHLTSKEAHTIESAARMALTGTIEHDWEDLRIESPTMPLAGTATIAAFNPLRLTYDGGTHELNVTVRHICDRVEAFEVAEDHILVRPVNGTKVKSTLVARSEYDYRVLSKPIDGESSGVAPHSAVSRDELTSLTVPQLRERCREQGVTGYSNLRKGDLIDRLLRVE